MLFAVAEIAGYKRVVPIPADEPSADRKHDREAREPSEPARGGER